MFESPDNRLVERELVGLELALLDPGNICTDQVINRAHLLVDLRESIAAYYRELPQPKDKCEKDVVILLRDEVVPTVHRLIRSV